MNIGAMIDGLANLRKQKKHYEEELKGVKAEMEELESELITKLTEMGTTSAKTKLATVSVSSTMVPTVENWDDFYEYVKDNDAFYMLQRRVSSPAWRELYEAGEEVPGTKAFEKISLNFRGT